MKRFIIILISISMMVFVLTACGSSTGESDIYDDIETAEDYSDIEESLSEDVEVNPDYEPTGEVVKSFELSMMEMENPETGELEEIWIVPGAEMYNFKDDLTFEYKYKKYATYEDMMNDANYEWESKTGAYTFSSDQTSITMLLEGKGAFFGYPDGNKIIMEFPMSTEDDIITVRQTYTETT